MSVFIDASVIAAIVGREEDELGWATAIGDAPALKSSAIAIWEAARAVGRLRGLHTEIALKEVQAFLELGGVEIVSIAMDEAIEALRAHARYGKGNHPAKLNMGDCFAYACARTNDAQLLYKGDDFALTDLA